MLLLGAWVSSYNSDILKLENIHLDAMWLVTGTTVRANIINLWKNMVAILLVITLTMQL